MLSIDGALKIIPASVASESGKLQAEGGVPQPVVLFMLFTQNGVVQVVLPTEAIDGIIENMQKAKTESEEETPRSNIYVPSSMGEVEKVAQSQKVILDETRGKQ